jgi:hypothetical protein
MDTGGTGYRRGYRANKEQSKNNQEGQDTGGGTEQTKNNQRGRLFIKFQCTIWYVGFRSSCTEFGFHVCTGKRFSLNTFSVGGGGGSEEGCTAGNGNPPGEASSAPSKAKVINSLLI